MLVLSCYHVFYYGYDSFKLHYIQFSKKLNKDAPRGFYSPKFNFHSKILLYHKYLFTHHIDILQTNAQKGSEFVIRKKTKTHLIELMSNPCKQSWNMIVVENVQKTNSFNYSIKFDKVN